MNGPMSRVDATATIPVEVASAVTKFVGGDGTGRRILEEPLTPGATVRSVLAGLSSRYPELAAALWHGSELGEHIEVLVNDRSEEHTSELQSQSNLVCRLLLEKKK